MLTNNAITLYHKIKGRTSRYERYNYSKVWVYGGHGASLNKGLVDMNNLTVRISYLLNSVDISNIDIGDIIVIGTLDTDITDESELIDYYVITSITDNKYGTEPHIHIGAR